MSDLVGIRSKWLDKAGRMLDWRIGKAADAVRRQGVRGCIHLLSITIVEPLLMKPFPLYVEARRRVLEFKRRRTAEIERVRWRSRREELLADTKTVAPMTDSLIDAGRLDRLRAARGKAREVVLADIDQDGFVCSRVGPLEGVPTVPPSTFIRRTRFGLTLVDIDGVVGVRKYFMEDVASFVAELDAAHHLRRAGTRVPAILDVDFDELTITFEYVPGRVLREELARQGAIVRDRDVDGHPSFRGLSKREHHAKRIEEGKALLTRVLDPGAVDRIFAEVKKVHAAGYVLHDVKFGNIILESTSGDPYLIDFDRARSYPGWSGLATRALRDRDYKKFNALFGTDKLTQDRVRRLARQRNHPLGNLYAPIYITGGLHFGSIWNPDIGDARWRYILRDNLPPLAGARVLDLGANNGFNAVQMLRGGAREVVGVERDGRAIAQARFVRDLFEWADNRRYQLTYLDDDMARLPHHKLGTFDFAVALCSIYYLDEDQIASLIAHVSTIAPTLVLQCNTDRGIRRSDPRTSEKASVSYAVEALHANGFPATRIVAPNGYTRPLVIASRGDEEVPHRGREPSVAQSLDQLRELR